MTARRPASAKSLHFRPLVAWLAAAAACAGGCDREVATSYATVRGTSINGVSAFVQLLRDSGHTTTARQTLPDQIESRYRAVVIFDDSFTGLDPEAHAVVQRAVGENPLRTVLLVLRDSDALIAYLGDILAADGLSKEARQAAFRLLEEAEAALAAATAKPRRETPPFSDGLAACDRPAAGGSTAVRVRGEAGQTESIPARWPLRRRLELVDDGTAVWTAGDEPLLVQVSRGDTEFLVLASAAPLLNGGLVDPGNRDLAERLARMLPTDAELLLSGSPRVATGGSGGGSGGASADDTPGEQAAPAAWRLLLVQPLPWLAAQALLAIGLFCWSTAPIFGRPRRSSPEHVQDFGHHVDALASLLAKAGGAGASFSQKQIEEWRSPSSTAPSRHGRRWP
jgi:hypothetical protein